ncbi:Fic family protein [Heliobacterium undosum]|uniref:Fic family protein n=1 Tax=Heliomicrobium undosum TaxID=121734 RepID=A0A845L468_9FIRM|nr:Fic family protein [Heliomicrobium undosum]MZP31083.1 Fic family protein [Heliomicrobium undosum]
MEIFREIDRLKQTVDRYRPLCPELMWAISRKFREEWTYHTNALEGNTMTLQETVFFLREGLTVEGRTLREHMEMLNHVEAIDFMQDTLSSRDLSERLIKDFHAILFSDMKYGKGEIPVPPGLYKTRDNYVVTLSGEIHHYCPHYLVPEKMEEMFYWLDHAMQVLHPVETAAVVHQKIVAIHPFPDGNGRTARLAMNFLLLQKGYPPAIIPKERRREYYAALEEGDQGKPERFIRLVAEEVKRSLLVMHTEIDKAVQQQQPVAVEKKKPDRAYER